MKYRTRQDRLNQYRVDAIQWDGTEDALSQVEAWAANSEHTLSIREGKLHISTDGSSWKASNGDWVVRLQCGGLLVYADDCFQRCYEPAVEPQP